MRGGFLTLDVFQYPSVISLVFLDTPLEAGDPRACPRTSSGCRDGNDDEQIARFPERHEVDPSGPGRKNLESLSFLIFSFPSDTQQDGTACVRERTWLDIDASNRRDLARDALSRGAGRVSFRSR